MNMRAEINLGELKALVSGMEGLADEMVDAGISSARLPLQKTMKEIMASQGSPSAPGAPPGIRHGHLRRSIQVTPVVNHSAQVGTNVEYGIYLEYGTSSMAARPWAHRSLNLARPEMEAASHRAMLATFEKRTATLASRAGGTQ